MELGMEHALRSGMAGEAAKGTVSPTAGRPPVPPMKTRVRNALGALRSLSQDPGRLDQVLVLLQAVNAGRLADAVVMLDATEEGRRFFAEDRRIDRTHVDFDALRALPEDTLGGAYARFLDAHGITPDAFERLPDVADIRVAKLMLRLRQTHDLWHVLTGYEPDVAGELLLQAFMYAQTRAPGSLLLVVFGTLRWQKLDAAYLKQLREAFRRGKATKFLLPVHWEALWETPLRDVRAALAN